MIGRRTAIVCFFLLLAACGEGIPSTSQHQPRAIPVQHVAAAAGAGVAWFAGMRGITPDGQVLNLSGSPYLNGSRGSWGLRSSDGGRLYVLASGKLEIASAADGGMIRAIDLPSDLGTNAGSASVSPDGRWLGLATPGGAGTKLVLIDLEHGELAASGTLAAASGGASAPSGTGLLATPNGRLLVVTPDGQLVVVQPQGRLLNVTARAAASALSCYSDGPPLIHLAPGGGTLIGYCPFDGSVWWFDLSKFKVTAQLPVQLGNPFWGSPVFSPDERRLYIYDSWKGRVNVVDLAQRRLLRSGEVARPQVSFSLPFVHDAFAKGPNFSASLSADMHTLFVTGQHGTGGGLYGVDTETLAVKARWLDGRTLRAVWAGGDGLAVYAVEESAGNVVDIIDPNTGNVRTLRLDVATDFVLP
jgi:hypothetical protein